MDLHLKFPKKISCEKTKVKGPSPLNPFLAVFSWQLLKNYKCWISIYSPGIKSDIHPWHKWVSIAFGGPGIVCGIEHQHTERNRPVQSHLEYEIWIELMKKWRFYYKVKDKKMGGRGSSSRVLFIPPLSLITSKSSTIKLNWITLKSQPHLTSPCTPPPGTALEYCQGAFVCGLGRWLWCAALCPINLYFSCQEEYSPMLKAAICQAGRLGVLFDEASRGAKGKV